VEIRNQRFLNEADEFEPEFTENTIMVLNLTWGFQMTEAGIGLSEDNECNEQRIAAAGEIIMSVLAFLFVRRF
jgi:hypothetical protein